MIYRLLRQATITMPIIFTPPDKRQIPLEDIGEVGAKTLFDILDGKDYKVKIKLANSIIERESCRIVKIFLHTETFK